MREIYHLLLNIDSSYNTEDGQIRFLEDNRKKINLGEFWSIITPEMKQRMTYWSKISMPFEDAKDLRTKLLALSEEDISKYNTEDGQIRFLEDNHKINSLADFWTLIPQEIKEKMTHWKLISLPFKEARDLRHKLLEFTDHKIEKYNTEDGQIRFLEDNRLTINLEKFRSIIPQEIKEKMTHWKKINLSFKKTKDLQKKILSLTDDEIQEYNTED